MITSYREVYVECGISNREFVAADVLGRADLLVKHLITPVCFVRVTFKGVLVLGGVEVREPMRLTCAEQQG